MATGRSLDGFAEYMDEIVHSATARVVRKAEQAAEVAGREFVFKLQTTGGVDEHPFTRSPDSMERRDTGRMLKAAGEGLRVDESTDTHFKARVGFTEDQAKYFLYQDQGWTSTAGNVIAGANALATARAVLEQELKGVKWQQ